MVGFGSLVVRLIATIVTIDTTGCHLELKSKPSTRHSGCGGLRLFPTCYVINGGCSNKHSLRVKFIPTISYLQAMGE